MGRGEVALKEAKGFTSTVGGGVKGLSRAVGGANFLTLCLYPFLSGGAWAGAGGGGVGVGMRYIGQGVGIRWEP